MNELDNEAKTHALIAYGCMLLGLFTGAFWVVGAIWAMVKKSDAQGSIFEDHYDNIIKTFWWGLGFAILGGILTVVLIGFAILFVTWVWSIYKIVKGLAQLTSDKSFAGA